MKIDFVSSVFLNFPNYENSYVVILCAGSLLKFRVSKKECWNFEL